jgi:hypothetical protein
LIIVVDYLWLAHDFRLNGALDAVGGYIGFALLLEADVSVAGSAVNPAIIAITSFYRDTGCYFIAGASGFVSVVGVGFIVGARLVQIRGANYAGNYVGNIYFDMQLN